MEKPVVTNEIKEKALYRVLCDNEPSISIFSQAWWLDATAGAENWDVVLKTKGNEVEAALPFYMKRRFGVTILTTPSLTPSLGPWLKPCAGKASKIIGREKSLLTALFKKLPEYDVYQQNWSIERQNWQPLYWMGFEQTTAYTYQLRGISDVDRIWSTMDQNTRNDIRKARDRNGVTIRPAKTIVELLKICNKTFERQKLPAPYSREFVERVVQASAARNAVEMLVAEGPDGNLHAGALILYSKDVAYYIMGGGDSELRNSGAASLILWEAILRSKDKVKVFDFEGSMIESIERFFRGFGGELIPYLSLRRTNSWRGQALLFGQEFKKRRTQLKGKSK